MPGWKTNHNYKLPEKLKPGETQKYAERRYYSCGYDINLNSIETDKNGKPKRNRQRMGGFSNRSDVEATAHLLVEEKEKRFGFEKKAKADEPRLFDLIQKKLPLYDHP